MLQHIFVLLQSFHLIQNYQLTMDMTQLQSFIFKFHQLWAAGETAHLDLDTHAGKAWVGLHVNLDQVHQQPNPSRPQRRSPSYYRRQEKRRAAGATAAETSEVETRAEEASTTTVDTYEEATPAEEVSDAVVESAEKVDGDQEIEIKNAEQAPEEFFCEICDFKSKGGNGLEIHMTRKHGMIQLVDGAIGGTKDDMKYDRSVHYWKTGRIGISYQTYNDILDIVENSELPDIEKKNDISKVTEARKEMFGSNYKNFPPWK